MENFEKNVSFRTIIDGVDSKVTLQPCIVVLPESIQEFLDSMPEPEIVRLAQLTLIRETVDQYRADNTPKDRESQAALDDFVYERMSQEQFKTLRPEIQKIAKLKGERSKTAIATFLNEHDPVDDVLENNENIVSIAPFKK